MLIENLLQDTTYAARTMRRNRIFVATAILTLALAIGGTTAIFALVQAILLKPLPYPDSAELVRFAGGATAERYAEAREGARSLARIGAFTMQESTTLSGMAEPVVLKSVHVPANFLQILGVTPLAGRSFRADEDADNAPPVAMISAELWARQFGSDARLIGSTATLDSTTYTIIGVLPAGLAFPSPGLDVFFTDPAGLKNIPLKMRALSPVLNLFGRLEPGVTMAQANAAMRVLRAQYAKAHPAMLDAKPKTPEEVLPLKDALVGDVGHVLWLLLGAVGFVLLIACANLASLLLIRASAREREFAVRSALGAARGRLMAQLLLESLLLSAAGGALGLLLASFCLRIVPAITAIDLPRANEIALNGPVVLFAVALSIVTGVAFGLTPSWTLSRPDLIDVLRTSGVGAGNRMSRRLFGVLNLRSLFSVVQVALSIVLLVGAALLMESIAHLRSVPLGFAPQNIFAADISLPATGYNTLDKKALFFQQARERIGAIPGVRSAAAAMTVPMTGYAGIPTQDAARPPLPLNERPIAKYFPITPGYFQTLQIALKRGRDFDERDKHDAQRVAIIDENLARHFWPAYPAGIDPVGQHLWVGGANPKPAEVIGIVANVSQSLDNRENPWPDSVYLAMSQADAPSAMLVVRTSGDPLAYSKAIREKIRGLDRNQSIGTPQTMEDLVEAQLGQRRLLVRMLGSFAAMAVLLALIGIYGVTAYSVAQRTQEMGIRQALGAQRGEILRLILTQGMAVASGGILAGLGGAYALTRLLGKLIFEVSPTDFATFSGVAVFFFAIALAASYVPARRATEVDPMSVLRL